MFLLENDQCVLLEMYVIEEILFDNIFSLLQFTYHMFTFLIVLILQSKGSVSVLKNFDNLTVYQYIFNTDKCGFYLWIVRCLILIIIIWEVCGMVIALPVCMVHQMVLITIITRQWLGNEPYLEWWLWSCYWTEEMIMKLLNEDVLLSCYEVYISFASQHWLYCNSCYQYFWLVNSLKCKKNKNQIRVS